MNGFGVVMITSIYHIVSHIGCQFQNYQKNRILNYGR